MSKQTRREFFENSLLASAAAASSGSLVAQPLFAGAGKPPRGPNERIRVAVLGVRGRGQAHLDAFMARDDVEVVAVVDPDELIGQKKGIAKVEKETKKKPAFYKDMQKVMDDTSIDVVSIATPNHWHALAAVWAIQHDKDVYVEKPVSHNVAEGRLIVEAARKRKKIVQTGTQARSHQAVIEAIQHVQSGGIGEVKFARAVCFNPRGPIGPRGKYDVPDGIDYNIWLGPAPESPTPEKPLTRPRLHYDWHWQWDTGNGDLGNQGIHQMDIARWGLGIDTLGDSVMSYGGRLGYEDAGETANTQVSVHTFGDKRIVFEVRGLKSEAPPKTNNTKIGVIFEGTQGKVVIPNIYSVAFALAPDGKLVKKFTGGGDHIGNFLTAVKSRKTEELTADILEGHLSSALCHLGNISYNLGEPVTLKEAAERLAGDQQASKTFQGLTNHLNENAVNLDKSKLRFGPQLSLNGKDEIFTDQPLRDKANQMLTREYRKGFALPELKDV